ncbi:helix-turn-helix domain-containing protein [Azospirillum formosense]|uniref:Helix-turn-helix domain-containing protein n=1 Tax=Azospirillum formosense TaxID=861533 RepID=A0ABX2KUV1_9PROT|nr:helix-turn-helix domain-containing protein [Azospirillum formosense]
MAASCGATEAGGLLRSTGMMRAMGDCPSKSVRRPDAASTWAEDSRTIRNRSSEFVCRSSEEPAVNQPDRLAAALQRVRITARVFHAGGFCGTGAVLGERAGGHLHLLRGGRLGLESGQGRLIEVMGPAAVLLPRAHRHHLTTDVDERSDAATVDLVCADIDLGGLRNPLEHGLPDVMVVPLDQAQPLATVLELLFGEAGGQGCGRQVVLDRLAEVAIVHVLRHAIDRAEGRTGLLAGLAHPALSRALVRLHEQPSAAWTLERMADEAGMSRSVFAETFAEVVGMTPGLYLRNWRLQLARARLDEGATLKQTAREVGYASHAALSRALSGSVP